MCLYQYSSLVLKDLNNQLTCLLLTLEVVFEVLLEDKFESTSLHVSPLEPEAGFDVDNVVTGVETAVKVDVTCAAAFEFIGELATPVAVAVGCTAVELAIRSESLSDKSELLEELSLMSQWLLDPALLRKLHMMIYTGVKPNFCKNII